MGGCLSSPEVQSSHNRVGLKQQQPADGAHAVSSPAHAPSVAEGPPANGPGSNTVHTTCMSAPPAAPQPFDPSHMIPELLLEMSMRARASALAVPEITDVLVDKLPGVDLCSIHIMVQDSSGVPGKGSGSQEGDSSACVLLAVAGVGAEVFEGQPLVRDEGASVMRALQCKEAIYVPSVMEYDAASDGPLPSDFEALNGSVELCCIYVVPIVAGTKVYGVLMVASTTRNAFTAPGWRQTLLAVANVLVQHLTSPQLMLLSHSMAAAYAEPDMERAIATLLIGIARYMKRSCNFEAHIRLGLVDHDSNMLLLLEKDPKAPADKTEDIWGLRYNAPAPAACKVVSTKVPMANTLMAAAIQCHQARTIKDCAAYFQSCMHPSPDVYTNANNLVSSLAVVPFSHGLANLGNIAHFGGFYVTLNTPCNFVNIQAEILGAVSAATLVTHGKIRGQLAAIRAGIQRAEPQEGSAAAGGGAAPGQDGQRTDSEGPGPGAGPSAPVSVALTAAAKRMCTKALMKVVSQKLQTSHQSRRSNDGGSSTVVQRVESLQLLERIGAGGFGICYRGLFKRQVAAIKVMYARNHERQAMKDAVEMAVLEAVHHPYIVNLYDCLLDQVEEGSQPGQTTGELLPSYRSMRLGEQGELMSCNIIVMEYCDRGTLREAMKRRYFHKKMQSGVMGVDLGKVLRVLMQVADAVEHLHSRKLLHSDIKMENVLLKTDVSSELGFICKLGDFGLAKLLNSEYYVTNKSGCGTVTHLAPELIQPGSKLTATVDSYSFGIMMYEVHTCQRAYPGLTSDQIIERIIKQGGRPSFPAGAPAPYVQLATRCWSADPEARPLFPEIIIALLKMLEDLETPPAVQQAGAGDGAAAAAAGEVGENVGEGVGGGGVAGSSA